MLGNGKRIWQPTAMQERKSLRMNKEQKQFLLSSLFSGIMIGIGCTVYLSCVNKLVGARCSVLACSSSSPTAARCSRASAG